MDYGEEWRKTDLKFRKKTHIEKDNFSTLFWNRVYKPIVI